MHEYDNRYLWMNLKRIVGSHFANYREAWEANRLVAKGLIHPTLSKVYPLAETGQAASTSTTTSTRARSACSRSRRRRDWVSSTTSGARSTSTRSTASAGSRSTTQPSPGGRAVSPRPGDYDSGDVSRDLPVPHDRSRFDPDAQPFRPVR